METLLVLKIPPVLKPRRIRSIEMLGIIAPTLAEAASLTADPITPGKPTLLKNLGILQISGMGPERAGMAAAALAEKSPTALVSWGTAGGLAPALRPGDLILPEKVIGKNGSVYRTDKEWMRRLAAPLNLSTECPAGTLVETTSFLTRSEEKKDLFLRTGGFAVDMESAAVGAVAGQHGIPFIVIRAIADPAEMNAPSWCLSIVNEFGRLRPLRLLAELSRNPGGLLPLLRLGLQVRAARKTLTHVKRCAMKNLLSRKNEYHE